MTRFRTITVDAAFTPDGWPLPHSLTWDGAALRVLDVGRRWKAHDGIHVLVRTPDERVFELHTNGALWRARIVSEPPHFA
ncbi:MAG: hypothetical protein JXQ72_14220 [Anaerolineae bacterium]|nr:hypothetical protein [Anaerolineae bacterium]